MKPPLESADGCIRYRMDREHVEPRRGLHGDLTRLHELLCDAHGRSAGSHGLAKKYVGTTRKTAGRSVWTGRVKFDESTLEAPVRWRKPRRIFVNSMSDLFHEAVDLENIRRVWEVMERADWHTYQILTKRPERMREVFASKTLAKLPHVWLGTSVESAAYLARLDELRNVPAAIRFVSFEPLLGSVAGADLTDIDWAIVGGESGPRARPMSLKWVTQIREICQRDRAAFFFKQWGGTNKKRSSRILDGKAWDEYPVAA